ncbi:YlxM family DNA-binding protein [Ureaplasma canigenitalium]|uniref:YlxM family DNA-binding protein n=1 Tax=Ureaplasma canigenitalium TaxID=42092 RepID=UPI0004E117E1|nr:hypothetical protein [Ureaplasma canigenitalium]
MENKRFNLIDLFDLYKCLLTAKQISYFTLHYHQDLSLLEIAETFKVSRAAVFDSLNKIKKYLYFYEDSLKLYEKRKLRRELYKEIKDEKLKDKLFKLDE